MSLFDVENKLYKKKVPENLSEHDESLYDPETFHKKDKGGAEKEKDAWLEKRKGLGLKEKRIFAKGALFFFSIIFIILATIVVFEVRRIMFSQSSASVFISGPKQALSGKLLTYKISYKNDNYIDLKKAVIQVTYPSSFKPEDNEKFQKTSPTSGEFKLGTVKKKSQGEVILNGENFSPKGALIYIRSDLLYSPAGFSGRFKVRSQIGVNVTSTPIGIKIQAPQNITSGNQIDYLITYQNRGKVTFKNLAVKVDYPDNFTLMDANPTIVGSKNIWYIGDLVAGQSGKILIEGKIEGARDQTKIIKVEIGVVGKKEFIAYNNETASVKIVSSPLAITQTVNETDKLVANAGDVLRFLIKYKNEGNLGLRNVIITERLKSPVLDYASLDMPGGSFDFDSKTITWKASDIPNLKDLRPGQEGKILFNIRVKKDLPVEKASDKNFVIHSLARIDSPDIPTPISMNKIISGNPMNIKINSKLILAVESYYNDYHIPNSGPNPPKVNQETTYTLRWKVSNVSNDIANARVEAILPTNAVMTGKIFPDDARIVYNARNNSIVWNIGNIKAGVGILSPPMQAGFQVKIKPSPEQLGKIVGLLNKSTFSARDYFTGNELKTVAGPVDTGMIKDNLHGDNRVTQ